MSSCNGISRVWNSDNNFGIWEKVDWMVYHFDRMDLQQRLLAAVQQFSEPE